ncbi:MAG: hypothetical protein OEL20_04895 [Sulfuritalea sp.]|nr:hypothetical protein [Sulfuritalea sp.]
MPITKQMLKAFRADLDATMKPLAEKYGVRLAATHGSYLAGTFTMKVEGVLIGAETREEVLYKQNEAFLDLPPLGSEVTIGREVFIIKGMKPRGRNNILIERKRDQQPFCCATEQAQRQKIEPSLTLSEFVKAVNDLQKAECDRLNAHPNRLFGATYSPYPEQMLKVYHGQGLTPTATLRRIRAESEREGCAEALAS